MKKLYRKGTVHPSPPVISDQLSFLPATILTLTAVLSAGDKEVLAYLISCSGSASASSGHRRIGGGCSDIHAPVFNCNCFGCYMSYWIRWDSSPNRQVIHEIIDAFEDRLAIQSKIVKTKKEKRSRRNYTGSSADSAICLVPCESESALESTVAAGCGGGDDSCRGGDGGSGDIGLEKGSVTKIVSFIGERIWSVWSH